MGDWRMGNDPLVAILQQTIVEKDQRIRELELERSYWRERAGRRLHGVT